MPVYNVLVHKTQIWPSVYNVAFLLSAPTYSLCPILEGKKDALSYKFRRLILVRIVVLCAQTRLLGPRGHRDAFSSSSKQRKRRAFRQACLAGHWALSKVRGDICSLSWSGGRFHVRAERHLAITRWVEQLLLACSEGCGLHYSVLL